MSGRELLQNLENAKNTLVDVYVKEFSQWRGATKKSLPQWLLQKYEALSNNESEQNQYLYIIRFMAESLWLDQYREIDVAFKRGGGGLTEAEKNEITDGIASHIASSSDTGFHVPSGLSLPFTWDGNRCKENNFGVRPSPGLATIPKGWLETAIEAHFSRLRREFDGKSKEENAKEGRLFLQGLIKKRLQGFFEINSAKEREVALRDVFLMTRLLNSQLAKTRFIHDQNDANEFLGELLRVGYEVDKKHFPIILQSELEPADSKDKSKYERKEPTSFDQVIYMLPCGRGESISKTIENELKPEYLNDQVSFDLINKTTTSYENISATKKTSLKLQSKTNEFFLGIQRGSNSDEKDQKTINLDEINVDVEGEENKQKFTPTAIICHSGKGVNGGHYVSYVKEIDNQQVKWFKYDDSDKTEVESKELKFISQNAVSIKYSKVNEGGVALPRAATNGCGISNQGNNCYLIAATTVYLSKICEKELVANYQAKLELNKELEDQIKVNVQKINQTTKNFVPSIQKINQTTKNFVPSVQKINQTKSQVMTLSTIKECSSDDELESVQGNSAKLENLDAPKILEEKIGLNYDLEARKALAPSNSPVVMDVLKIEPEMKQDNASNIWNQKKDPSSKDCISSDRQNRYRVAKTVYQKEGEEVVDQKLIKNVFRQAIVSCAQECKLTSSQDVIDIITLSKKRGGISNKLNTKTEKYQKTEKDAEELANSRLNPKIIRKFSALFQKKMGEMAILTGREGNNVLFVGLRLTFLPDDICDEIANRKNDFFYKNGSSEFERYLDKEQEQKIKADAKKVFKSNENEVMI